MRTISANQQAVLAAGTQAEYVRVQVKDAGGTFRDLTTYPGFNAVKSVKWTEQIDNPHATFDISLFRELYQLSLSPYVSESALNLGFAYPGTFAALLAVNRELKIEVAIVATDTQPQSGDWMEVFHGRIETLDVAQGYEIQITGTALSGRLSKQYIKTELVYSFAATGGLPVPLRVWEPGIAVTTSPLVYCLPATRGDGSGGGTADPGYNKFLVCSQAGTTGGTEPVWTTGAGQVDGTAKWDYVGAPSAAGNLVEYIMQNIMNDNVGSGETAMTLFTPSSPGWSISQFIQQREFTMDALVALATQIGFDVRTKWRAAHSAFELTFYGPTRSSPSLDHTFAANEYRQPTMMKVDIATIRNKIRVIYPDAADLWPDGTAKRKTVEVSDSTSITKYGELWCEIQEDQSSNIDTLTEATAFANACLSDCKEPTADMAVPLVRGFPFVELNDYYKFSAGGPQFDSDQSLAVTQYQHSSDTGKGLRTTLQVRGLPTIGARKYLKMSVHPQLPTKHHPHKLVHFNGATTPSAIVTSAVGGQRIVLAQSFDKVQASEEYEHHVYTVSGTTLSASTLKAVTKSRVLDVADLIAGKKYYHRVVSRFRNGDQLVRSQPSIEINFIAGRAFANHLNDGIALGSYPLNGGFETRQDTSGFPDWWTATVGALGVDFFVMEDGNGVSGGRYMKIVSNGSTQPNLQSALLPIINESGSGARLSGIYRFRAWVKTDSGNVAGGDNMWLAAKGVNYTGSSPAGAGLLSVASDSKPGLWQLIAGSFTWGFASAKSAFVNFFTDHAGSTHGQIFYIDEIRFDYIGSPLYVVGIGGGALTDAAEVIPNFANGWADGSNMDAADDCFYASPGFRRTVDGYGEIVGHAMSATPGSGLVGDVPIFTLPPSFRPLVTYTFPVSTDVGPGWLQVQECGDVCLRQGGNGWVDFGVVRFPLFAFV